MKVRELKAKRAEILAEARKLTETADAENRSLSDEERSQVDSLIEQADNMQSEIETREKLAAKFGDQNSPANIGMSQEELETRARVKVTRNFIKYRPDTVAEVPILEGMQQCRDNFNND